MHRRSDRGRLAVDLCLVFDLGDHADSGPHLLREHQRRAAHSRRTPQQPRLRLLCYTPSPPSCPPGVPQRAALQIDPKPSSR